MSGFHEVLFPMRLAFGASGGPERRTEIITLASGREVRNAVWANAKRRWTIGSAIDDVAALQVLLNFFEARQGRLYGFRFKDPLDHISGLSGAAISANDQVIGIGDGTTSEFQLRKIYGETIRKVVKPVAETVKIAVAGAPMLVGWSVDSTTGIIRFDTPPGSGEEITAGFEFDCAVRFDADRLDGVIEGFDHGRIVNVDLVELLLE
ncbi:MAG: DUF2460 domain-containing protein [Henriciella sp.]|nr:DUF2460 domain-containing protein [Henriciella sp.]